MAKIVVLDDHVETCGVIKFRLEQDGHEVVTVSKGKEAIEQCLASKVDVLITDWDLEDGYDGLEIAEIFRIENPDIKLLLITGYSVDAISQHTSADQFYGLIPKPFKLDEIAVAVNKALTCTDT